MNIFFPEQRESHHEEGQDRLGKKKVPEVVYIFVWGRFCDVWKDVDKQEWGHLFEGIISIFLNKANVSFVKPPSETKTLII